MTATATRTIEFQLIRNTQHGIIGRLYIPADCRGMGRVKGKLVYDSDRSAGINCNHKSRTIEFVGSVEEYQRCIKQYAPSNLVINRMRTVELMQQLSSAPKAFVPKTIADPWEEKTTASEIVTTPVVESKVVYLLPPAQEDDYDFPMRDTKVVEVTLEDYAAMTHKELKELAKFRGIKGASKMKKQHLAQVLYDWEPVIDAGYDLLNDEEKLAYQKSIGVAA